MPTERAAQYIRLARMPTAQWLGGAALPLVVLRFEIAEARTILVARPR